MKVLVTGASGRLGPFVVSDLAAAGRWNDWLWAWVGTEVNGESMRRDDDREPYVTGPDAKLRSGAADKGGTG